MGENNDQSTIILDLAALENSLRIAEAETDHRQAAICALVSVVDFLRNIPNIEQENLYAPLWNLAIALDDLNRGSVAPIFKASNKGYNNRHPDLTSRKEVKGYSSYFVDYLMETGMTLDEACRQVAKCLQRAGFKIKGKGNSPPARTVRNWRDGATKLSPDNIELTVLQGLRELKPLDAGLPQTEAVRHVGLLIQRLVQKTGTQILD